LYFKYNAPQFIFMTKKIFVAGGHYCLVDDDDYPFLQYFKWHLAGKGNYATTCIPYFQNGKTTYCHHRMHRMINQTPEGRLTDHINGDVWDNRKCNLRSADDRLNRSNIINPEYNSHHYPGVFAKVRGNVKWYRARIVIDKKKVDLGYFKTPEEAGAAYQAAKEKRRAELLAGIESHQPSRDPPVKRDCEVMQNTQPQIIEHSETQ